MDFGSKEFATAEYQMAYEAAYEEGYAEGVNEIIARFLKDGRITMEEAIELAMELGGELEKFPGQ